MKKISIINSPWLLGVWLLTGSVNAPGNIEALVQENAEFTVAVIVWGHSDTPLAQEITDRLRHVGFEVPDATMHKGSRYGNYTDRVEVRYTSRGQAKLPIILQELAKIPGLSVKSKLYKPAPGESFALAGDIQIQFPIILP